MKFADDNEYRRELIRAMEQERLVRDASLLGTLEHVAGYLVLPLNLTHYLTLQVADSPFLPPFGRIPTEADLAQLLWVVHPSYTRTGPNFKRFMRDCRNDFSPVPLPWLPTRRALARWQRKTDVRTARFVDVCKAAKEYVEEAFQDRPPSSGEYGPEYYSSAISMAGALAREYGWSLDIILRLPLKVVFQCLNETREWMAATHGQKALMFNPSDRVKADYLRQLNKRN